MSNDLKPWKTAYWKVSDLNIILAALEGQGAIIHAVEAGEGFIRTDWMHDRGEPMFEFKPAARQNDMLMMAVRWLPEFEKAMGDQKQ